MTDGHFQVANRVADTANLTVSSCLFRHKVNISIKQQFFLTLERRVGVLLHTNTSHIDIKPGGHKKRKYYKPKS